MPASPYSSIQLVLASPDDGAARISRSGCFPPLGLLSLATWLSEHEGLQATVLDGELLSFEDIAEALHGGLVGISVSELTYANAIRLAEVAKERGAKVIFGGHHATALAEKILHARPCVDAVVLGDGEEAFAALATASAYTSVPNLVYRGPDGSILHTPCRNVEPARIPIPNRELVKLEPYFAAFRRQNPNKPFWRPFSVWTQKGCEWRDRSGGCSFCARTDTGWRARPPEAVWQEVSRLCHEFGADYIWELSDDILSDPDWFARFAAAKPAGVHPAFMFYARPANVTETNADALVSLGAYEVFLGIESGDDQLLRLAHRGSTCATSIRATRILGERGLRVFPSFVLGLEGETLSSLRRTEEHLHELMELAAVDTVAVCRFMPLPGSPAYNRLMSDSNGLPVQGPPDHIDLTALQSVWLARYCNVTLEDLNETRERMIAGFPVASGMGIARSQPALHAKSR